MTEKILSKVPEVTIGFWIIKILATTLGETGGDALSMSLHLGYLVSTGILAVILLIAVGTQIAAKRFHPGLYWTVIVATTMAGTTLADFCDRDLLASVLNHSQQRGYLFGSSILLVAVLLCLGLWKRTLGTVSTDDITTRAQERFYWATITLSQTLGTALGDWLADTAGLGYEIGALVFGSGLLVVAALYFCTKVSRPVLFWTAFILTRPLGATLGDFLDKPFSQGGHDINRFTASVILAIAIVVCVLLIPQRAGRHPAAT